MQFADKIVVVTGASRGIGAAIARAFAAEGAQVACVATTLENANRTAETLGNARPYACNVSDPAAVEALFAAIQSEIGTPAVLVNNAGITRDGLMMRMKDGDWDEVLAVNLKAAFLTTRAVLRPMMKARYGRIINVASVIGLHGGAGQANYAAAKAGMIGLTMSTAREVGSRGITCNAVAPGFIATDMTSDLPEEFRREVESRAPAGRLGTPEDVAGAVVFLASEGAGYITGQTLTIDGGLFL
ncbi:MAG: 3-oxoacyl-[acyl-carrier-protein] reductase [Armatimonadota bacterium]